MSTDDDARKEYAEAGVDLPEISEEKKEETPAQPEAPAPDAPKPPEETPADPEGGKPEGDAPPAEPKEPRKRSIYDDLKEKKEDLKIEKQKREQAERERDEIKEKLNALASATTPEKREEAADEVTEYAKKIGADPEAVRTLVELARKGMKPELPGDVAEALQDFQKWKTENSKAIEQQAFEQEFKAAIPSLKEIFPSASDEEMDAIKTELDRLSHTREMHDKPLDFIAFKNRATLSALVSPRKPGLEKRGRVDGATVEFTFDPNADYSKLSPEEKVKWEAAYKKMTSSDSLLTDQNGRKTIL